MKIKVEVAVSLDTIQVIGTPSLAELRDMGVRCAREEEVAFPVVAVVGYGLDGRRRLSDSSAPLEVEFEVRAKRGAYSISDFAESFTFFGMANGAPVRATFVISRTDGTITSSVGAPIARMCKFILRDWS